MKRYFQSSISAVALSAMLMSGVVATVSITVSPAFSKNHSANSNSDNSNRGGRNNGNNGRGSIASSLGALNAAHANANAVANPSLNSRVGMIPLYRAAVMAWAEADAALVWFRDNCEDPVEPDIGKCTSILEAASLVAESEVTYLGHVIKLTGDLKGLDALADEALTLAANKSTDEEVLAALWDLLELPSE